MVGSTVGQTHEEESPNLHQKSSLKSRRRRRAGDTDRPFPVEAQTDFFAYAEKHGAKPDQLAFARELDDRGLREKARRAALCGVLGGRWVCEQFHWYYRKFRCGLRSCPYCARIAARKNMQSHGEQAAAVAPRIAQECRRRGLVCTPAVVEFVVETADPPTPRDMRKFNTGIKAFLGAVQRRSGSAKDSQGAIWSTEAQGNTLRAKAFYVGPRLSADLADACSKIVGANARLAITPQRSISAGVMDVLQVTADTNPTRSAETEAVCDGVRRLHSAGAFYGRTATAVDRETCPKCGRPLNPVGGWRPIASLESEGAVELGKARRQMRSAPPGA
jgi:hypothetical protein